MTQLHPHDPFTHIHDHHLHTCKLKQSSPSKPPSFHRQDSIYLLLLHSKLTAVSCYEFVRLLVFRISYQRPLPHSLTRSLPSFLSLAQDNFRLLDSSRSTALYIRCMFSLQSPVDIAVVTPSISTEQPRSRGAPWAISSQTIRIFTTGIQCEFGQIEQCLHSMLVAHVFVEQVGTMCASLSILEGMLTCL